MIFSHVEQCKFLTFLATVPISQATPAVPDLISSLQMHYFIPELLKKLYIVA